MAGAEAAKDFRQQQVAEAGSTALMSWHMLGCAAAQCPVMQTSRDARLIAEPFLQSTASFVSVNFLTNRQTNSISSGTK